MPGEAATVTVRVVVAKTKPMDSALAGSPLKGEGDDGLGAGVNERSQSVSVMYLEIRSSKRCRDVLLSDRHPEISDAIKVLQGAMMCR